MNDRDSSMRGMRALTRIMDEAVRIPGTRFRLGLDALLGLVPGFGDAGTALIAGYALIAAARMAAPASVLGRMAGNILLDTLVGSIPVAGDVFDAAFKANRRNLRLLEQYHAAPERTRTRSRGALLALAVGLVLVVVAVFALALALTLSLVRSLTP